MSQTVKDILIAHLNAIGADGLCNDACGCGVDDLAPCCSENLLSCIPAKHHPPVYDNPKYDYEDFPGGYYEPLEDP